MGDHQIRLVSNDGCFPLRVGRIERADYDLCLNKITDGWWLSKEFKETFDNMASVNAREKRFVIDTQE